MANINLQNIRDLIKLAQVTKSDDHSLTQTDNSSENTIKINAHQNPLFIHLSLIEFKEKYNIVDRAISENPIIPLLGKSPYFVKVTLISHIYAENYLLKKNSPQSRI